MTPFEQAASVYESEPCARSFSEDVTAHFQNGYVFSTPQAFVMARPVDSKADPALIVNPWETFAVEQCDAWLIYLCAGDFGSLLHLFPYPLLRIGWERSNVLRWYPFDKALEKLTGKAKGSTHDSRLVLDPEP